MGTVIGVATGAMPVLFVSVYSWVVVHFLSEYKGDIATKKIRSYQKTTNHSTLDEGRVPNTF